MSTQSDVQSIREVINRLDQNRASRFSYTQAAFDDDDADGVEVFDKDAEQNIPTLAYTDYNPTVLDKGARTQGASIPRMAWNHFIGRFSYNLNKVTQKLLSFLDICTAALAHNAAEYDQYARYKTGDVCYVIEGGGEVFVYSWYRRVSVSPLTISGIPPTVPLHWKPVFSDSAGIVTVSGLYAFEIRGDCLLMFYNDGIDVPLFWIDETGKLNAEIV